MVFVLLYPLLQHYACYRPKIYFPENTLNEVFQVNIGTIEMKQKKKKR